MLLATETPISSASTSIDDINNSLQTASSGDILSFTLQEDTVISPYRTPGDPYAAPEWGAVINPEGVTLQLSGLKDNGQKSTITGEERNDYFDLTRPLINKHGSTMKVENLIFNNCVYYRWGKTAPLGGAISNTGGFLEVRECDFNNNGVRGYDRFSGGGAISSSWPVQGESKPSETLLIACKFTGNYATTDPKINHSSQGGAFLNDDNTKAVIQQCTFSQNYVLVDTMGTGNSSGGGAVTNWGKIILENSSFIGNHVISTGGAIIYGGAIWHFGDAGTINTLAINNASFEGNYIQSSDPRSVGGALCLRSSSITTIIDSSFVGNFSAVPNYGGGAIDTAGPLNMIAAAKDILFRGNKHFVTQVENGQALDGISNAITTRSDGYLNLVSGNRTKIIFDDSILASINNTPLNINPDTLPLNNETGEQTVNPYARNGEVVFHDNIIVNNFTINLSNGSIRVGDNTFIKGTVNAQTGTSFLIDGFTTLSHGDKINLQSGTISEGTTGSYNVTGADGEHTVRINMNDAMVAATDTTPVWAFADDATLNADPGKLVFVLDISGIQTRPKELHPFIFSHTQSAEATQASVAGAKHVFLVDNDGWSLEYKPYTANGTTYNRFDFLSGQYGVQLPQPPSPIDPETPIDPPAPPTPSWQAPLGVGTIQANTLWTSVRSLWTFAGNARTNTRYNLKLERNVAVWISGIGNYFTQENQASSTGYRYRSLGYAAGGEYSLADNWTTGMAIGTLWGDHDVNNGLGRIDKDTNIGLLYGTYGIALNKNNIFILDMQAGYARSNNKGTTSMQSISEDYLNGKWTDQTWMLDMKAIWRHQLNDRFTLETFSGLQYTSADQNNHTLQGDKYQFQLSGGSMNDLRATIGSGIYYQGSIGLKAFTAYTKAGIIQDLNRKTPRVNVLGNSHLWTACGNKPGRTSLNTTTGIRLKLTTNLSTVANYTLESSTKSLMQTGSISLIHEF